MLVRNFFEKYSVPIILNGVQRSAIEKIVNEQVSQLISKNPSDQLNSKSLS